jgi:phosphoglucosamine mutase
MRQFFGTDGIRGRANQWPITSEFILKMAMASAVVFGQSNHPVVIGKDTRLSGYMIESALMSGFVAMGMEVILVGVMPTPALSMLTKSLRASLGVMISASHNPFHDNGIKFFGPDGHKLTDIQETKLESLLDHDSVILASPDRIGKAYRLEDAGGRYIEFSKSSFPKNLRLDGLKIVVDCAHGATYKIAPKVLWELGAEIIPIAVSPTGLNINENSGALHPEMLQKAVLENNADVGLALDGDGDRLIMVDEKGTILDGDQILALIASSWKQSNLLSSSGIVATQMSNLGLERFVNSLGLTLHRSNVGDRYVLESMRANKCNVGGEKSGHIIFSDYATTGDGLIAALQVLRVMIEKQKPLSECGFLYNSVPQINTQIDLKSKLNPELITNLNTQWNDYLKSYDGTILIRPSGTEPILRIMAQGDNEPKLKEVIEKVIETLQQHKVA